MPVTSGAHDVYLAVDTAGAPPLAGKWAIELQSAYTYTFTGY